VCTNFKYIDYENLLKYLNFVYIHESLFVAKLYARENESPALSAQERFCQCALAFAKYIVRNRRQTTDVWWRVETWYMGKGENSKHSRRKVSVLNSPSLPRMRNFSTTTSPLFCLQISFFPQGRLLVLCYFCCILMISPVFQYFL